MKQETFNENSNNIQHFTGIYFTYLYFRYCTCNENLYIFRAASIKHGYWTAPYFDCNGLVPKWLITYAAPFFGWDSLRVNLEFK